MTSNYSEKSNIRRKKKTGLLNKIMKKKVLLIILFLIILPAMAGLLFSFAAKIALLDVFLSLTPSEKLLSETNVLILGIDATRGTHRSDTIMVAHLNTIDKEVKVVSIPRDTLVYIPGIGLDKINHSYAHGGIKLTKKTVSKFLNISVPYYVIVNISGLEKIIDKLGGIRINVEKRMYYVDHAGGLYVDLYPGPQILSGKKALGYVRFRADGEGDMGRIKRQQKFLSELARQFMKAKNMARSPRIAFELLSNIDTNLNVREIIGLYLSMRQALDFRRVAMVSLPGKDLIVDGIYYWKPDPEAVKDIRINFLKSEIPEFRGNIIKDKKTS